MSALRLWSVERERLKGTARRKDTDWTIFPVELPLDDVVTAVATITAELETAEGVKKDDSWTRYKTSLEWFIQDSLTGRVWFTVESGVLYAFDPDVMNTEPSLARGMTAVRITKPLGRNLRVSVRPQAVQRVPVTRSTLGVRVPTDAPTAMEVVNLEIHLGLRVLGGG